MGTRKIFFIIFTFLITTNAWPLTITCKDKGDIDCTVDEQLTALKNCNAIPNTNITTKYLYLTADLLDKCSPQIKDLLKKTKCSDIQYAFLEGSKYLLYCSDNTSIRINYQHSDDSDNWSYVKKQCIGSHGIWDDGSGTCTCQRTQYDDFEAYFKPAQPINNECICTGMPSDLNASPVTKYPGYSGCVDILISACSATGGEGKEGDGNDIESCNCPDKLNLELDSSGQWCNCKDGTDYIDPLHKNKGCSETSQIPGYGSVDDQQSTAQETEQTTQQENEEITPTVTDSVTIAVTDSMESAIDTKAKELAAKLKTAKDELAAARDKENSWANRGLSAASTAATGLGAMAAASALAERVADRDAEKEMRQIISNMKCDYTGGPEFNVGNEEITLPGGNELFKYYTEYKTLADNLKTTKAALGLRSGIESEVLYERAQSGLYQSRSAERMAGGETSLYRAMTDTGGDDAAAWADQKDKTTTKLTAGGVATGVGVVGGAVGNYFINRDKKEDTDKK